MTCWVMGPPVPASLCYGVTVQGPRCPEIQVARPREKPPTMSGLRVNPELRDAARRGSQVQRDAQGSDQAATGLPIFPVTKAHIVAWTFVRIPPLLLPPRPEPFKQISNVIIDL